MATVKVRDVMTADVQCLGPYDTVQQAGRLMRDLDVGSVPVCGDDLHPVGIVTDRDLVLRCVADGGDATAVQIRDVMRGTLVTLSPDQGADAAAEVMAEHQLRRLPVVDTDGVLVGILAQADVARAMPDALVGDVVGAISAAG